MVGQGHGQQFVVTVEEVGERPLADRQAAGQQLPVNLGDAAVLGVAQGTDEGDDIQPQLMLGQGIAAFGLGAVGPEVGGAVAGAAAADLESEADEAAEGDNGAVVVRVGPPAVAAGGAVLTPGRELLGGRGFGSCGLADHPIPPWHEAANPTRRPRSASSQLCRPSFFPRNDSGPRKSATGRGWVGVPEAAVVPRATTEQRQATICCRTETMHRWNIRKPILEAAAAVQWVDPINRELAALIEGLRVNS